MCETFDQHCTNVSIIIVGVLVAHIGGMDMIPGPGRITPAQDSFIWLDGTIVGSNGFAKWDPSPIKLTIGSEDYMIVLCITLYDCHLGDIPPDFLAPYLCEAPVF